MFINESLVAVFFKVGNFGLIIALGSYVFQTYIKPNLVSDITKKEREYIFLTEQSHELAQKYSELDEIMRQESQDCGQLKLKVDTWKKSAEHDYLQLHKEHTKRHAELEQKRALVKEWRKKTLIRTTVAHAVASELHTSLTRHFKDEKAGELFLKDIFSFMNERVS